MKYIIVNLLALLLIGPFVYGNEFLSSISQYGITWEFDRDYETGKYVNGDWYVVAPSGITIISITPTPSNGRNGVMVNPSSQSQAFDSRASGYSKSLLIELPYKAQPEESIVASISIDHFTQTPDIRYDTLGRTRLETAAVLTIVSEAPSTLSFRPPYVGDEKPTYTASALRLHLLPRLDSSKVKNIPSLENITRRMNRLQLDYIYNPVGQEIRPTQNMESYGGYAIKSVSIATTRILLNDPIEKLKPLIYAIVQYGIDSYWSIRNSNTRWPVNGGHNHGRKSIIVLAATLLGDDAMISQIRSWSNTAKSSNSNLFQDDWGWQYSPKARLSLWGSPASNNSYWDNQITGSGIKTIADPHGWIDGGNTPGFSYQGITGPAALSYTILSQTLEGYERIWNNPSLSRGDREWNFGTWARPDPIESTNNGIEDGIGRYPSHHASKGYNASYTSSFIESVVSKNTSPSVFMPNISPYNTEEANSATVVLERFQRQTPENFPDYWNQYTEHQSDGEYPYLNEVTIRYTIDDSEPTDTSPIYTGPFEVGLEDVGPDGYAVVKAKGYKEGWNPSSTNTSWIKIRPYVEQSAAANSAKSSVSSYSLKLKSQTTLGNYLVATAAIRSRSTKITFEGDGWNYVYQHTTAPSSAIAWKKIDETTSNEVRAYANASSQRMAISLVEIGGVQGFIDSSVNTTELTSSNAKSSGILPEIETTPQCAIAIWAGDDNGTIFSGHTYSNDYNEISSATTSPNWTAQCARILVALKHIDYSERPSTTVKVNNSSFRATGAILTFRAGNDSTKTKSPPKAASNLKAN